MRVVWSPEIAQVIEDVRPVKIAVAYLGWDWPCYVKAHQLKYILLSPHRGTNPLAVAKLVEKIGWDRVFFHGRLHAKLYLGKAGAVVGSANLSANGLGPSGNVELAAYIDDDEELKKLHCFADELRQDAARQWPTPESKAHLLRDMERQFNLPATLERHAAIDILDFPIVSPALWVAWGFRDCDCKVDREVVSRHLADEDEEEFIGGFTSLDFLSSDETHIRPGDWLLSWTANNDGTPSRRAGERPCWQFVVDVIPDAISDAFDGNEWTEDPPYRLGVFVDAYESEANRTPPFELYDDVCDAILKVLRDERFAVMRPDGQADDQWSAEATREQIPAFLQAVKLRVSEMRGASG